MVEPRPVGQISKYMTEMRELYQVCFRFIVRFNGIWVPCFEVGEIRMIAGADGEPNVLPVAIKAALLSVQRRTLGDAVKEAGVKDVCVDVIHLTLDSEQRITRIVELTGCDLMYTLDKLKADENELVFENVLVTPKDMNISLAQSGRPWGEFEAEEDARLEAEAAEKKVKEEALREEAKKLAQEEAQKIIAEEAAEKAKQESEEEDG